MIDSMLISIADKVDQHLRALLHQPSSQDTPLRLAKAMAYATLGGGKRLRAFLVIQSCKLFNIPESQTLQVAAAIELIHTYSLIHDDLPCMDNASMRRGKATCHLAFDEATAVLAGDALLTLAFEILTSPQTHPDTQVRCQLMGDLAKMAGWQEGMALGQTLDIMAEKQMEEDQQILIEKIALLKTGRLMGFAASAGATMAQATSNDYVALLRYGESLGIAYQMVDDILDHNSSTEVLGKDSQIDYKNQKTNFISLYGIDKTKEIAHGTVQQAKSYIQHFGKKAIVLQALCDYILERQY